ncbi:MAG: T9SS type A sorting domain-containing protein [bacterium]|nr:T9SS type A sorting domain-containing protein [bacterium]
MKRATVAILVAALAVLLFGQSAAVAKSTATSRLSKSMIKDHCKYIDVNQIRASVMNNGTFTRHPITGNSDLEWPKGTGKYACYAAGIWIAGKVGGATRTACADYNVEYQPGLILPDGTPDNPADPKYRVYKVHKDYPNGYAPLDIDPWSAWPVDQGAPVNPDGSIKWYGDEQLYAVMNDMDVNMHNIAYHTLPIGIELHLLVFAFDRPGALGNVVFFQYTIVNKGADHLQQAYIGVWSDVDLGDANDDLIGYDLERGMAYVYNGDPIDATYGDRPPALGFDFFRGPMVPSPGDTVKLPDGSVYPNKKLLDATAFVKYYNPHPIYRDPRYSAEGAEELYNYLAGLKSDGSPWVDPTTGQVTTFLNTGDPVRGTGWLSTMEAPPQDIRILISSGPFTLAKGDTQVVVAGMMIGQGNNRLSSIEVLRFYDKFAQAAYDKGFEVPSPPRAPEVLVTPLDRKVLLTWGKEAENYTEFGYDFEGYNVYIGASAGGPWTRLATYDVANGVMSVLDEEYDPNTGFVLQLPSAYGADLGLSYSYTLERDYEGFRLANGRNYYVCVTAYGFGVKGVPKILESSKNVLTVTPHQPQPGTVVSHEDFEEVPVTHSKGNADPLTYEWWVQLVDPLRVTTADYKVTVNPDCTWTLYRNGQVVSGYDHVKPVEATKTIDKDISHSTLVGAPLDFYIAGRLDFTQPKDRKTWLAEVVTPTSHSTMLTSLTGPYQQGKSLSNKAIHGPFKKGTTDPRFMGNTIEIRFTGKVDSLGEVLSGGSLSTLLYGFGDPANFMLMHPKNPKRGVSRDPFTVRVPFEVWDVTRGVQVNSAFCDNAQKIADTLFVGTDSGFVATWSPRGKCTVFIFWTEYNDSVHNCGYTGQDKNATWMFVYNADVQWQTGDVVRLKFPPPVMPGEDEWTFSIKGVERNVVSDAKKRLDIINVYPNPYLAHNIEERTLHQEHVRFINLPEKCTIRIFNLAGDLIQTIEHDSPQPTHDWDLRNENFLPVASGLYIAHIEVPGVGSKVLKLAVVFGQQRLRNL